MPHVSWVVPIHNQSSNIPRIMYGFASQTRLPDSMVFVTDKCSDDSFNMLQTYSVNLRARGIKVTIAKTDPKKGFGAGMTRDTGLLVAEDIYGPDIVIFTDGDCIPSQGLVEAHIKAHESLSGPAVICGARTDIEEDGSFSLDPRLRNDYNKEKVFASSTTRYVVNPDVIVSSWACWSCNMSLNVEGIERCREINQEMVPGSHRVFSPVFDGRWGGEDGFVAMSLFYSDAHVLMLEPAADVTHIWHPRSHTNIEHLFVLKAKLVELRKLCHDKYEHDAEFKGSMLRPYDGQSWMGVGESSNISSYRVSERTSSVMDAILAQTRQSKHSRSRQHALAYMLSRNPKMCYTGGYLQESIESEEDAEIAYFDFMEVREMLDKFVFVPVRGRQALDMLSTNNRYGNESEEV